MHNDDRQAAPPPSPLKTPDPRRRGRPAWLLVTATAFTLAVGLGVAFKYHQLRHLERAARAPVPALANPGAETNLAGSLLTDSILSIVQSYYVDPGRVDNRGLLD